MKIIKLTLIISLLAFSFTRFNETKPIPAFYLDKEISLPLFIKNNVAKGFYPITMKAYAKGEIDVPKNMMPYVLIEEKDGLNNIQLVSINQNNLNIPSYLWDYDPLEKIKAIRISDLDLEEWQRKYIKTDLYISDGDLYTIMCTEEDKNKIFLYAPTENMKIEIYSSIPFINKGNKFPTKQERQKSKRIPLKGYHLTSGGIPSRKEAHVHKNFAVRNGLDSIVLDFKTYLTPVQFNYKDFDVFMNESNDYLLSQLGGLVKTIEILKLSNTKVSLRIVVATDYFIQKTNQRLMLWDKKKLQPWTDYYGQQWVDLFSQDALNYYKKIVELAIAAGADDVQLDYIRFPSDGDVNDIVSKHNKLGQKRYKAVDNYLKEIVKITDKKNISFTADIFGIVLWDNPQTNNLIGQYTLTFMRYADVICPMLYPSHFNPGFDGIAKPGENPYLFMDKGCKKFVNFNWKDQYYVKVVPWIQAFNYMSPNYNEKYIQDQIRACLDNKMDGVFAWNAGNDYTVFFNSLKSGLLE